MWGDEQKNPPQPHLYTFIYHTQAPSNHPAAPLPQINQKLIKKPAKEQLHQ